MFFSQREQVIRLIMAHFRFGTERAARLKARGGVPVEIFKDFMINGDKSFSLTHIKTFLK